MLPFYLHRISSIFKNLTGQSFDYCGAKPPGWQDWAKQDPTHVVAAKQWVETIKIATCEGRKLPPEDYLEVQYEKLLNSPREEVKKISDFAEIQEPQQLIDYAVNLADPSRINRRTNALSPKVLDDIRPIMEPTMSGLGYLW